MRKYYPVALLAVIVVIGSSYALIQYREKQTREIIREKSFEMLYPEISSERGMGVALSKEATLIEDWNKRGEKTFECYAFVLNEYKKEKEVLMTCYVDDIQIPFQLNGKKGVLHSVFLEGEGVTTFKIEMELKEGEHRIQLMVIRKNDLDIGTPVTGRALYKSQILYSPRYFVEINSG
ncbi:MAG: hypothetical protein U9N35_00145 [Euryarchaeota archaeon]|nr:hypothetical protein [Euryarchaeota archaeon]